jgi:hypothetical protein
MARLQYEKASKALAKAGTVDKHMLAEDEITIVIAGNDRGADRKV